MTFTVKHTVAYPGGNAQDPGYRSTVVAIETGRTYCFLSDVDGSHARSIGTRPADRPTGSFRSLSHAQQVKAAPELEACIKAHIQAVAPTIVQD